MNSFKTISSLIKNSSYLRLYSSSGYTSAISLSKLYPHSSLKLTTPQAPQDSDKFTGFIPVDKLDITYSRSSGPGGQNVNMVNTKVEVRFRLSDASWINEQIKKNLAERLKNKITKDGFLIFRSDLTRSQHLNLADCLEKIRTTVRNCSQNEQAPSEETQEKIRRRLEKATRERLAIKKQRSFTKENRRTPDLVL